jgi:Na+(H+)/acetate symporter ActP
MIGVTAAASAGIYLHRGYIDPGLSMPVMLGVLVGSLVGTRILVKAKNTRLRIGVHCNRSAWNRNALQKGFLGDCEMAVERTYQKMTDTKIENILGNLLRAGVALLAAIYFAAVLSISPGMVMRWLITACSRASRQTCTACTASCETQWH